MNASIRTSMAVLVVLVAVVVVGSACGSSTSNPTAKSTPPASGGPGKLGPAVSMPRGFPSDFPVYPGARLTSAGQVNLNGQMTWGVQWETLDSVDSVQSFYTSKLNQGDWTIKYNGSSNGIVSVIFTRRSNDKQAGILTVESQSNVTHISLALGMPG